MLRQVHEFPRFVINDCSATSTDTLHRVRFKTGVNGKNVTTAFLNSLTFAFSEITGRSYGGGVMTFEPTEAERLLIPMKFSDEIDFEIIDKLIREKGILSVLDIVDNVLLIKGLGLSKGDVNTIRNIWVKLRDRRNNRR